MNHRLGYVERLRQGLTGGEGIWGLPLTPAASSLALNRERVTRRGVNMKIALLLKRLGLTSTLLHSLGAASIAGSVSLWGRSAAASKKDAKARAERLAIFVGLWPPTFFLLGKVLQDLEATPEEQVKQARVRAAA